METNLFRNMRSVVCAALLALGATTAFATTETVNFLGCDGMGTSAAIEIIPNGNATGTSADEVSVLCDGTVYFNGAIPYDANDWRISSVAINGVRNANNLTVACAVNGVSYANSSSAPYTFTGSTLSEGVLTIKLTGTGNFYFTTITIEYEQVSVPHITWTCSNDDDLTATSTVTIDFSEPMYINGTLISNATQALVSGEITMSDYDDNEVEKIVTVNSDKQIVVTTTGAKNCGEMYSVAVSNLVVNSAGSQIFRDHRSDAWIAHEETIAVTGKGIGSTLYVGETFAPATDLVVTADGTDVTAECTFGNISTAAAGSKTLTVTHGLCTKEVTITVTERANCTITWKNEVTSETLDQSTVKQGISLSESGLTTLPTPTTTVLTTDCGQKAFVGWSRTAISGSTDDAPTLVTTASIPSQANITLYAVYADGSSVATEGWKKITSVSELPALVGKQILIANTDKKKVLGQKSENGNNFTAVNATIATDGTLTPASGYTAVTLGGSAGAWTFQTDAGYLYCASTITSKKRTNKLDVQTTLDDKGKWTIEFTDGELFVRSVGCEYTNNRILYNGNTTYIFSCYENTTDFQFPIDLYVSNATSTGYITNCNCTSPTWSGTLPTVIGKGASLAFGITSNSEGAITYSCDNTNVTITDNKFQVSADGSYDITITQAAAGDYCTKTETRTMTITVGDCSEQSFHYGIAGQDGWNYLCFDADANERHIYNFTIPTDARHYYVGYQKGWDGYKSETVEFQYMPFALLQNESGSGCNRTMGWGTGVGQGAVGTLRIYHSYSNKNWFIGFIPDGYVLRLGSGSDWSSMAFSATNDIKTVWETELVTLTDDNIAGNYYVGLKANTADGFVWCNNSEIVALTSMGVRAASDWSGRNISASDAGTKGNFRMWANNCDGKNWLCHFVPYYDITYMNADNSTVFATSDAVSIEATSKEMTVIATYPTKSGYRFAGWSETADATTATYAPSATITLTKNHVFYPVFVQQVTLTYDANGGTSECGSVSYDINATATLCTDGAERTGYRFNGWSTTKDDASTIVTSLNMNESRTLYALWEKYLIVTYNTTNLTLASGCEAVQADKVAGETVTLCGTPTSTLGYTFDHWIVTTTDGTETTHAAGTVITLSSDVTVQAKWDVPDITFTFVNQGAGAEYQKTTQVTVPQDTYLTAPTSVTVPTNCDGKVFIGWASTQIDDETTYSDVAALTAAGHKFLSPGDKLLATNSETDAPRTWYAVFARTE